jgi:hypothetical protein
VTLDIHPGLRRVELPAERHRWQDHDLSGADSGVRHSAAISPLARRIGKTAAMADQGEAERIEASLRRAGWADHTSIRRELRAWARLAEEVATYGATVDDYTNDLCSRDYLKLSMANASTDLCNTIAQQLAPVDESFRQRTVEDVERHLERYFQIDRKDDWWWRRLPGSGPLADYLRSDT